MRRTEETAAKLHLRLKGFIKRHELAVTRVAEEAPPFGDVVALLRPVDYV